MDELEPRCSAQQPAHRIADRTADRLVDRSSSRFTDGSGDRRVRRTRAALRQAIVALVLDKGFHSITGEDIADHADVTRTTYYKHYLNKEDLLADVVDDFTARVRASFDGSAGGRLQHLFEQIAAEPDICRLILRGEGDGLALRRFTAAVEEVVAEDYDQNVNPSAEPPVSRALAVSMRAAAIVASVGWFLEQDDVDAALVAETAADGVLAALHPSWMASLGHLAG